MCIYFNKKTQDARIEDFNYEEFRKFLLKDNKKELILLSTFIPLDIYTFEDFKLLFLIIIFGSYINGKIIEGINIRDWKIDVLLSEVLISGKCFIANPTIAWQKEGFSDIENKVIDYTDFMLKLTK